MADLCKLAATYLAARYPDLTMRQIALLGMIGAEPGQSSRAYAVTLGVGVPIITRATRRLESVGLTVSVRSESDGRKVAINPTLAGLALRQAFGALGNG